MPWTSSVPFSNFNEIITAFKSNQIEEQVPERFFSTKYLQSLFRKTEDTSVFWE